MSPSILDEIQLSQHISLSGTCIQRGFWNEELNYNIFLLLYNFIFIGGDVGFLNASSLLPSSAERIRDNL